MSNKRIQTYATGNGTLGILDKHLHTEDEVREWLSNHRDFKDYNYIPERGIIVRPWEALAWHTGYPAVVRDNSTGKVYKVRESTKNEAFKYILRGEQDGQFYDVALISVLSSFNFWVSEIFTIPA